MKIKTTFLFFAVSFFINFTIQLPVAIAEKDQSSHKHHQSGHEEHDDFWNEHHDDEEHHGHTGEHGGQFGDASDMYHYEVLLDERGDVAVYMYDDKAVRIKNITNMEVRWTLNPDSEYPLSGVLALSGSKDHFILDLPTLTSNYVSIKIEAEKDGQWWPVEFLLEKHESQ